MNSFRIDELARQLGARRSRRVLLGFLGIGGLLVADSATAKRKKKKKKKQAPPKPPPSCTDGVKNGSESDVDCGGTCPRCDEGKTCATREDCATAHCTFGACQACVVTPNQCGTDRNGGCFCDVVATGGPNVCGTRVQTGPTVTNCAACPAETHCVANGGPEDGFGCFKLCGAA